MTAQTWTNKGIALVRKAQFKKICDGGQNPKWWNGSVQSAAQRAADLCLGREAIEGPHAKAVFGGVGNTWLSCLVQAPGTLIKEVGCDAVWMVCDVVNGKALVCWPMESRAPFGVPPDDDKAAVWEKPSWQPAVVQDNLEVRFVHITVVDNWEVVPSRLMTPMEMTTRGLMPGSTYLALLPIRDPENMFTFAARSCFQNLSKTVLDSIMEFQIEGYDPNSMSLYAVLVELIKHNVPGAALDESKLLEILEKRAIPPDDSSIVAEVATEAIGLLDKQDAEQMEALMKKKEEDDVQRNEFRSSLQILSARVHGGRYDAMTTAKGMKFGKARLGAIRKCLSDMFPHQIGLKFPTAAGYTSHTFGDFQTMLPAGALLYHDVKLGRWLVSHRQHGSRSRAWALYGKQVSLRLVTQWCWKNRLVHESGGRLNCLDCPVTGVFDGERGGNLHADTTMAVRMAYNTIP